MMPCACRGTNVRPLRPDDTDDAHAMCGGLFESILTQAFRAIDGATRARCCVR
ncbi:hypothetical protein BURMUCF2_A1049 [Burkholderia multivorans CF2]|nr:hypothetical protein BURMUCF2_A1049 [Burkholderia multivorans CF2]